MQLWSHFQSQCLHQISRPISALFQLSRQHLAQPQRAQPSVHPSHLLLQQEGKAGANRQSATKLVSKNMHVHAQDGCRRSAMHNFNRTYDTGTASNVTQGTAKWQKNQTPSQQQQTKRLKSVAEHLVFSRLCENKDDYLVEVKTKRRKKKTFQFLKIP